MVGMLYTIVHFIALAQNVCTVGHMYIHTHYIEKINCDYTEVERYKSISKTIENALGDQIHN